jgi:hypothetical protein
MCTRTQGAAAWCHDFVASWRRVDGTVEYYLPVCSSGMSRPEREMVLRAQSRLFDLFYQPNAELI